jgi:hypothetical protein
LADYKIFIPETSKEYNEKYKEDTVKENTIVKTDKRNRSIEDDLTKITGKFLFILQIATSKSSRSS